MYQYRNKYNVIVCVNDKNVIGNRGELLYHIKSDLRNFKSLTEGNVVIMGRKTFESLPDGLPLKNRVNIVITGQDGYHKNVDSDECSLFDDTYVCNSLEEVDELCYAYFGDKELYIIGGGSVYEEAFNDGIVEKVIITHVNDDADGDVCFPDIEHDERYRVVFKTTALRDQPNELYYHYIVYKKKNVE